MLHELIYNHLDLKLVNFDLSSRGTRPNRYYVWATDESSRNIGPSPEHRLPVGVLLEEGEESTPAEILKEYWDRRLNNVGEITDNSGLSEVFDALNKEIEREK